MKQTKQRDRKKLILLLTTANRNDETETRTILRY